MINITYYHGHFNFVCCFSLWVFCIELFVFIDIELYLTAVLTFLHSVSQYYGNFIEIWDPRNYLSLFHYNSDTSTLVEFPKFYKMQKKM